MQLNYLEFYSVRKIFLESEFKESGKNFEVKTLSLSWKKGVWKFTIISLNCHDPPPRFLLLAFSRKKSNSASEHFFSRTIIGARANCLVAHRDTRRSLRANHREPSGRVAQAHGELNAGPDDDGGGGERQRGKAPKEVTTDLLRSGSLHRASCGRELTSAELPTCFSRARSTAERSDRSAAGGL